MAHNITIDGMNRLNINGEDGSSPNLTSRTPPPPGFDGAAAAAANNNIDRSGTPNTCKSTSFNNLAMALGTGLAESMDQGMDGDSPTTIPSNITATANNTNNSSELNNMKHAPGRIHTPDMYTRQSRHSVSRMAGGQGGPGAAGGFDYLNPAGTSHLLIPPSNSSYLNKLKEQQLQLGGGGGGGGHQQGMMQQQQQSQAGGSASFGNNGSRDNGNNGSLLSQPQQGTNQSSLSQAAAGAVPSALEQKPVRFTAAMMANAQTGSSESASFNPNGQHQLNQELLRQQLLQQSSSVTNSGNILGISSTTSTNPTNNYTRNNSNTIGLTVVEPPSASNSPAPQRGVASGTQGAMIGMNGDGLLYPLLMQQQQQASQNSANGSQQQQQLSSLAVAQQGNNMTNQNSANSNNVNTTNFILGPSPSAVSGSIINLASGGRASAPPPQSQTTSSGPFVPGGMTTMVMNNAAIRAYTASSLQMRVAELHQELGAGGMVANNTPGGVPVAAPPPGATVIRTMPAGAIPIVLTPAPTPVLRPPSRDGGGGNNNQISRSTTPSTMTASPNPTTMIVMSGGGQQPQPQSQQPMSQLKMMPSGGGGGGSANNDLANNLGGVDPEQQKREVAAVQDLKPFLRDPLPPKSGGSNSSGNNNSSSASTRGLAILYASSLHVPDVRSTCEAFGALESFRSDFGESRGVFFATFYDLRSAQLAVGELPKVLNKRVGRASPSAGGRVEVKYCVPLNSSSPTDESMLMLSKLPGTVDEQDLNHVLSSFGEVRAIHYQANLSDEDEEGNELASYLVEFYDVQDARQALLELEQTNPWGEMARVKVGTRSPTKRKQGKDLIMLMSCWRQGVNKGAAAQKGEGNSRPSSRQAQQPPKQGGTVTTVSPTPSPSPQAILQDQQLQLQQQQQLQQQETMSSQTARTSHVHHQQHQHMQHQMDINQNNSMSSNPSPQSYYQQYPNQNPAPQQYQLVVGPDGQYSYVLVNPNPHPQMHSHYGHPGQQMVIDPHNMQQQQQQQGHIMYTSALDQQHYMQNQHHLAAVAQQQQQGYHIQYSNGASLNYGMPGIQLDLTGGSQQQQPPTPFIRMPSNDVNSSSLSSGSNSPGGSRMRNTVRTSSHTRSSGSLGSGSSGGNNSGGHNNGDVEDSNNLSLSIDNVRTGRDRRTSLMVRNIPNKYTQQMLLAEFASVGHGSDKMDFFYLPIDFKNKCNRGYAFVNFVDYQDIVPFFDEYNGKGWKRFNSDKICDITYARIQGKAAMLKRFENSALMEKDDEYRPKVFVSHGERKGQLEVMPTGVNAMNIGYGR